MWDCSLFAKPDNDSELAGVDASGRDRHAVMTPEYTQRDMSTNQKLTNRAAEPDTNQQPGEKNSKKSGLDLSITQIVGGALAAMTAAALGAQLSVAGTVAGAALVSIITAVAGSLYAASIRRTGDKVKTVFWTKEPNEVDEPTVMEIVADREGHVAGQRSHLVAPEQVASSGGRRPKLNWKRVVVVALAVFGIAAVSLTALELVTGQAISGGDGTTFQQVSEGRSEKGSETKKKKAPSEKASKEATTAAPDESTPEPRAEASTAEPESTTTAPTPEANQTTRATPTPKVTPGGGP
jgi:hypothetical protein